MKLRERRKNSKQRRRRRPVCAPRGETQFKSLSNCVFSSSCVPRMAAGEHTHTLSFWMGWVLLSDSILISKHSPAAATTIFPRRTLPFISRDAHAGDNNSHTHTRTLSCNYSKAQTRSVYKWGLERTQKVERQAQKFAASVKNRRPRAANPSALERRRID